MPTGSQNTSQKGLNHMGKKSSNTVTSYTPTDEEKRLMQQASAYAEAVAPNALALNNIAAELLYGSYGTVQADFDQMNKEAQAEIAQAQQGITDLTQGNLPTAYTENIQNAINRGTENAVGTMVQSLADRGVLNSSVTNSALQGISNATANAMADAYNTNIATLANLYNAQIGNAAQNMTTSAAAQEYAQKPALSLWQASLGLNGANTSAITALSHTGDRTTTNPSSGLIGGVLTGAASSLFCFTGDTLIATPTGDKPIRHIKQGDIVLSVEDDGTLAPAEVLATMNPHDSETYTVLAGDCHVHTTLSQPLLLADGTMKLVQDLTIGDELARTGSVTGIVLSGKRKVYDLTVSGTNRYLANGFVAQGGDGT